MSDWRIHQCYGYGAARVPLNPDPPARAQPEPTFANAMRALSEELASQGVLGNFRNVLTIVPALGFVVALLIAILSTINRDQSDQTDLEIVQLNELPEPEVLEPEPLPEPVKPPEPEPVKIAEVKPPPPPPKAPEPPPPPRKIEPPPPPKPIVKAPPPKPPPPRKPVQVARKPTPPKLRIDPVRQAPKPAPRQKISRVQRPVVAKTPTLAPPPPIAMDPIAPKKPVLSASRAPTRSAPRSLAPPPRVAPPKVSIAPVEALNEPAAAPSKRPLPTRAARKDPTRNARKVAPPPPVSFDLSAPKQAPAARAPAPTRSQRSDRRPTQTAQRSVMPSSLSPVTGSDATDNLPTSAQVDPSSNRIDRVAPTRAGRNKLDDRLEGVALSSLAACRSDREEEELKLEVMGAIGGRKECVSSAGRYRFVETKNLNAFLMFIERASGRRTADRCVELRMTIQCLRGQ